MSGVVGSSKTTRDASDDPAFPWRLPNFHPVRGHRIIITKRSIHASFVYILTSVCDLH